MVFFWNRTTTVLSVTQLRSCRINYRLDIIWTMLILISHSLITVLRSLKQCRYLIKLQREIFFLTSIFQSTIISKSPNNKNSIDKTKKKKTPLLINNSSLFFFFLSFYSILYSINYILTSL